MKFSLYEILAKIIPGGMLFYSLLYFKKLPFDSIPEIAVLIVIYIGGYFIDALSSMLERPLLFRTFGKNPAVILLNGKSFLNMKLQQIEKLNIFLKSKYPNSFSDKRSIFSIIHRAVSKVERKRMNGFMEQYIFSRNILTAILISSTLILFRCFSWLNFSITIAVFLLAWFRTKQRNYYFVKETIDTFFVEQVDVAR